MKVQCRCSFHFLLNFSFNSDLLCCSNLSLTLQLVRNVYSLLTNVSLSKLGNIYSQREDKYIFSKRRKYIFQGRKNIRKQEKITFSRKSYLKKNYCLPFLIKGCLCILQRELINLFPSKKEITFVQ